MLPNAEGDHTLLNSYFVRRLNFTMQETAALMGAHTLGRMEGRFSGFSGGWTPRHHALTNSYYSAAVGVVWDKRLRNGKIVWEAPRLACDDPQLETSCGQTVVMLNVDMALFTDVSLGTCTKFPAPPNNVGSCVDSPFRTYSKAYTSSTSQGKWIKDFALAIAKMTKIGYAANALYSVDFVRSSI
uniref:Uncharacterized protein n=1 Tax=Arcella intermedia TaxID=1963864 RepID=A0A6B2LJE9_9EUKA